MAKHICVGDYRIRFIQCVVTLGVFIRTGTCFGLTKT